jgi:predicted DNA-binding transcriptional regulator AlpA
MTEAPTQPVPIVGINRALYPIKEVEVVLSLSHATVYRLINNGKLDARKIGARSFVTSESLVAFLASLPKVGEAA